jgi:hypothetical protein
METRDISGFLGKYKAREDGVIIGARGIPMKGQPDKHGYLMVSISNGANARSVKRSVHVLVAMAWHGERPKGLDCSHINGNRRDNRPANLCWMSRRDNHLQKRFHGTSGCNAGVRHSREQYMVAHAAAIAGLSKRVIAAALGISMSTVSGIRSGRVRLRGKYSVLNPDWRPSRKRTEKPKETPYAVT